MLLTPVALDVPAGRIKDQPGGDITFYLTEEEFSKSRNLDPRWDDCVAEYRAGGRGKRGQAMSYEAMARLSPAGVDAFDARVVVCRCDEALLWSVTCRLPSPKTSFAYDAEDVADMVWQAMEDRLKQRLSSGGLLIVAGATSTGKSTIAKHLCEKLRELLQPQRPGHVVSAEDPFESGEWFDGPKTDAIEAANSPAEARSGAWTSKTMRHRRSDMESLRAALLSTALRQTPTLMLVGEVREDRDWQTVVEYAKTGHWVLVTTHAGSLTQAVMRVTRALHTRTAADRFYLADAMAAVVHITAVRITSRPDFTAQLPAMWVPEPRSVRNFTNNGVASLLPVSYPARTGTADQGYFNRRYALATMFPTLGGNPYGGERDGEKPLSGHLALSLLLRPRGADTGIHDGDGPALPIDPEAHAVALAWLGAQAGLDVATLEELIAARRENWAKDKPRLLDVAKRWRVLLEAAHGKRLGSAQALFRDVNRHARDEAKQAPKDKHGAWLAGKIKQALAVLQLDTDDLGKVLEETRTLFETEIGGTADRRLKCLVTRSIRSLAETALRVGKGSLRISALPAPGPVRTNWRVEHSYDIESVIAAKLATPGASPGLTALKVRAICDAVNSRLPFELAKRVIGPKTAHLLYSAYITMAAASRVAPRLKAAMGADPRPGGKALRDLLEPSTAQAAAGSAGALLCELVFAAWCAELDPDLAPAASARWLGLETTARKRQRHVAGALRDQLSVGEAEALVAAERSVADLLSTADSLDIKEL